MNGKQKVTFVDLLQILVPIEIAPFPIQAEHTQQCVNMLSDV